MKRHVIGLLVCVMSVGSGCVETESVPDPDPMPDPDPDP